MKLYDSDAARDLRRLLSRFTLAPVACLPTPLDDCPHLSEHLEGPRILIKRDDMTGLALGGNKARQFTYSLGPAIDQNCDYLVHGSDSQSNQSRQTAAAAARLGMKCITVIPRDQRSYPVSGNLLLDHLMADQVKYVMPATLEAEKSKVIDQLKADGHKPYETSSDGAILRAVAYVDFVLELCEQLADAAITPKAIYTSSNTHTIAGLVVGLKAVNACFSAVGMNYSPGDDQAMKDRLVPVADECARTIGLDLTFSPDDFDVTCQFAGRNFGEPTGTSLKALRLVAKTEGIILDPVYTSKAMDGLIQHIRDHRYDKQDSIIFLHTGGIPALFAYGDELFG